jgi:glycerol-3-phosphate dehydrogenase
MFTPLGLEQVPTAATAFSVALGVAFALGGRGPPPARETIKARWVVNAAGNGSDAIAKLVGDNSFYIKGRVGEYLLLHKKEGAKARHILFPTPSKMGKGVLVQTTLWGNLILGPTAADLSDPSTAKRTPSEIMSTILARCRDLVPSFDSGEVIHSFAGTRAKSSRGDWIIEACSTAPDMIHAAGIDSPGLAGSPAIAAEVLALLQAAGMPTAVNKAFIPHRRAIIVPKDTMKLLAATVGADGKTAMMKMKIDGDSPGRNIICKCEKVLESEIVDAVHRSLPCTSTQAVRKRTRAGMGHCQAEFCEERVRAVIARETRVPAAEVPGRPWPASSVLPQRWLDDTQREEIRAIGL